MNSLIGWVRARSELARQQLLRTLAAAGLAAEYDRANAEAVAQVVRGMGPDDSDPKAGAGARIVFNMACAHVPAFCERSLAGQGSPYQNAYDLKRQEYFPNVASAPRPLTRREEVDKALEHATGLKGPEIYFGAVETSGTGVRFYGDMCLVLSTMPILSATSTGANAAATPDECWLLDRNSYDVLRPPAKAAIEGEMKRRGLTFEVACGQQMRQWLGTLTNDLVRVATEKVKDILPNVRRRWTGGRISEAILQDEDYFEVLHKGSFGANDLLEVRVSAADAAAESDIANRERAGEAPALHEVEWRQQRREARNALVESNVAIRVITTPGRLKAG